MYRYIFETTLKIRASKKRSPFWPPKTHSLLGSKKAFEFAPISSTGTRPTRGAKGTSKRGVEGVATHIGSKESPTGRIEPTPNPQYLITLATYLGVLWSYEFLNGLVGFFRQNLRLNTYGHICFIFCVFVGQVSSQVLKKTAKLMMLWKRELLQKCGDLESIHFFYFKGLTIPYAWTFPSNFLPP